MPTEPIPATSPAPQLMELLECSRQRCGHILWKQEMADIPHPAYANATQQVCPKCGCESFYTLTAQGRARTTKDSRENKPREINPADIAPTPRMGLKRKRRLLAAKVRAMAAS